MESKTVEQYADRIMALIDETIAEGFRNTHGVPMPATVASFSELHDYVDANDYFVDAEVPWGTEAERELTNQVADEVSRRLAARQAPGIIEQCPRCSGSDGLCRPRTYCHYVLSNS